MEGVESVGAVERTCFAHMEYRRSHPSPHFRLAYQKRIFTTRPNQHLAMSLVPSRLVTEDHVAPMPH
jgi:hypothetical protein